jgi:hypothetical protein
LFAGCTFFLAGVFVGPEVIMILLFDATGFFFLALLRFVVVLSGALVPPTPEEALLRLDVAALLEATPRPVREPLLLLFEECVVDCRRPARGGGSVTLTGE